MNSGAHIEITELVSSVGPLTKRISLSPEGRLISDGSACVMRRGAAKRVRLGGVGEFARLIAKLDSNQAIALGSLRSDLPDTVEVTTAEQLGKLNGSAPAGLIARTAEHISYVTRKPALVLLDYDSKGQPPLVAARLQELGGFWSALASVAPELQNAARVVRSSTSSGIARQDTGQAVAGSSGVHCFVLVEDGSDVERFLRTLHDRCWLHGLGWMMVGAGGQFLDRSIVDRMVYAAERLVFEGPPILSAPLVQDAKLRAPQVSDGVPIDTVAACRSLTIVEQATLRDLKAAERYRLAAPAATSRATFIKEHAARIAKRTGATPAAAQRMVERQCGGVLLPGVALPFDAEDFAGCTVGDVFADPDRFVGATLADPLEGLDYGRCKAKVMQRADGTLWINSFAHGRIAYELKHDAASVEAAIMAAEPADAADILVRLLLVADLEADDEQRLRELASDRAKVKARPLATKIKAARTEQARLYGVERQEWESATRTDRRPRLPSPPTDAPWLPQMAVLNEVLGRSSVAEPPMRDLNGYVTQVRVRRAPDMHSLSAAGANQSEPGHSRLPAPEHPLLTRLDDVQLSEMIEHHIDFTDGNRSVHLPCPFVRHYLVRNDGALPLVTAVATLPMVLPDGSVLSGIGLDRDRAIVFRIPPEVQTYIPCTADCTSSAVASAMRFLTDEWLVDVATDYPGKCVAIATVATLLERLLLPERPAVFIQAGQRGGGKTTAAHMISLAALGSRAAAAAWSPSDEERRKSLLAYLGEGVPLICWDNIPRGLAISCPSIEKALTASTYTDRVLGASESRTVPATAIHLFTGNNIAPRGDLASRSLCMRLSVDRPDPENRTFKHPDPLAWTEASRGRILNAIYTVLVGNPRLKAANPAQAETRFKLWWHVVGSAVEHAAAQHVEHVGALAFDANAGCPAERISFRGMFLAGEAEEEQTSSLNTVLEVLLAKWPSGFRAIDLASYIGSADEDAINLKAALEQASGKALKVITPTSVTWRLKAVVDAPVSVAGNTLALRLKPSPSKEGGEFHVRQINR